MATTLHAIPGVKLSNGKQAYGSREMAAWLPVFVRYLKAKHKITLITIKVADTSATAASAATHVGGHALDTRTWSLTVAQQRTVVAEGTRYGLPNCLRTRAQGFDPHNHGMLDIGARTKCSYQIDALRRGRDGLARNGADPDAKWRPKQADWLRWDKGLSAMLKALDPRPTVSLRYLLANIKSRTRHTRVKRVQTALKKRGHYKLAIDGQWGPQTKAAYRAWQRTLYKSPASCDGVPGRDSLTRLGDKTGVFRAHQF